MSYEINSTILIFSKYTRLLGTRGGGLLSLVNRPQRGQQDSYFSVPDANSSPMPDLDFDTGKDKWDIRRICFVNMILYLDVKNWEPDED